MSLIPRKILFINKKIMIRIKLPKPAIQNIKMFIGKVLPHNINIIFIANLEKGIH